MSKFTNELINDYANKLLIGLTKEENKTLLSEFEVIESNMDLVTKIEGINEVEPMSYPFIMETHLRDPKLIENEKNEDIIRNSGKVSDREIEVPRVVG